MNPLYPVDVMIWAPRPTWLFPIYNTRHSLSPSLLPGVWCLLPGKNCVVKTGDFSASPILWLGGQKHRSYSCIQDGVGLDINGTRIQSSLFHSPACFHSHLGLPEYQGSWLFPVVWDQSQPVTYGDIQSWQLPNTMPNHPQYRNQVCCERAWKGFNFRSRLRLRADWSVPGTKAVSIMCFAEYNTYPSCAIFPDSLTMRLNQGSELLLPAPRTCSCFPLSGRKNESIAGCFSDASHWLAGGIC